MNCRPLIRHLLATCAALLMLTPMPSHAEAEGRLFQPVGENLMIAPPPGWRLAYMNGDPEGDYMVDFLPANEAHDSWREGYMGVQRRSFPDAGLLANIRARNLSVPQVALSEVMQGAQRNCPGRFVPMSQKDGSTNNIPLSVSGGFCDRVGPSAPYGEGTVLAVYQGKERLFVVQFSWRPPTENALKQYPYRISPAGLQQFLDLLNAATLCGGPDEGKCPN
ncbi:hypothetical protein I5R65_03940 [Herbaspirillum sp. AP02]|uniref:hypothetical protein n=1 Tax=unclassified Herbaspirillum TaxID=2624150 RepID=UPI0015DACAC2|nr:MULTISPECIES: hypothetical protein [unclassified Herbaspirillum]MBG7618604.1 hypothetical protein [Herbaspirillum sp. AP02]NZD67594.1 hypothetical protein [Herbaspirillum sp. AP21]